MPSSHSPYVLSKPSLEGRNQFEADDHTNELVGANDRQLGGDTTIHLGNDVIDRGILLNANRIWRHDVGDAKRTHRFSNRSTLLDAQKRFDPVTGRTDAKLIAMQKISFRNNPDKVFFMIENGQTALIGFKQ